MIATYQFTHYLTLAKTELMSGNPKKAVSYTQFLLSNVPLSTNLNLFSKQELYHYLDAVTLHQSLLSMLRQWEEYLKWESTAKDLIQILFPENESIYYAMHLFDVCETMCRTGELTKAYFYRTSALSLLYEKSGICPYYSFMEAISMAQISFYMEDYYTCIEAASAANQLWYTEEYGQVFPPELERTPAGEQAIDTIGTNNILLLCNAYGKINHPKDSIALLEELLAKNALNPDQKRSAEITLAELYFIDNHTELALPIYEKYKNSSFTDYPDLALALSSLSYALESGFSNVIAAALSDQYCCSHNAFTVFRYNYALRLALSGNYNEALTQFSLLEEKGISMRFSLLVELNRFEEAAALKEKVNAALYQQIEQIIVHYQEELAYSHLAKLQYHIDLCLGAYCRCIIADTKKDTDSHPYLSPYEAYDFLLNTKYISLETSHLLHIWKTKQELPFQRTYHSTEIMAKLPADTLLLEFTQLRSFDTVSYGVFLVSCDTISYLPLETAEHIDELIQSWHLLLQESVSILSETANQLPAKIQKLNSKLRKLLFLPLKPYLNKNRMSRQSDSLIPIKNLLIAPAGSLVNFPFSRLSVSAGNYLGDFYQISYLNTGKELCTRTHSCYSMIGNKDASLLIGNPLTPDFPNLPFSEMEVDLASYFLNSTAYKGPSAALSLFSEIADHAPSLLHIAAHGIYQELPKHQDVDWEMLYQAMSQSGILLADYTLLSCTRISALNLTSVKLAILSCCHSGSGTYLNTEGTYGLRRAFSVAGCQTVIANLWETDDAVSFLWAKNFYESLCIGSLSIQEAFETAVNAIKNYEEDGYFPYQNPYYWAGFVLLY